MYPLAVPINLKSRIQIHWDSTSSRSDLYKNVLLERIQIYVNTQHWQKEEIVMRKKSDLASKKLEKQGKDVKIFIV